MWQAFKQRGSLHRHKIIHQPAKHVCDTCGKTFFRKEYLLAHIKTHGDKKECSKCGIRVFHIDKHVCKDERQDAQFPCDVCGKYFRERRYLQEHVKYTHIKAVLFDCKNCGKSFKNRSSRFNHSRVCRIQNGDHAMKTGPIPEVFLMR